MGSDRPTPLGGPDPPCTTRSLPGAVRGSPSHHPAGPRWGAAGRRSSKNRRGLSRAAPAPARSSPRLRSSSPPPNPSRGRTERSPGCEGRPDRRHRCPYSVPATGDPASTLAFRFRFRGLAPPRPLRAQPRGGGWPGPPSTSSPPWFSHYRPAFPRHPPALPGTDQRI